MGGGHLSAPESAVANFSCCFNPAARIIIAPASRLSLMQNFERVLIGRTKPAPNQESMARGSQL
jgi:hypothetical protein